VRELDQLHNFQPSISFMPTLPSGANLTVPPVLSRQAKYATTISKATASRTASTPPRDMRTWAEASFGPAWTVRGVSDLGT
jgi:hypothetical protein